MVAQATVRIFDEDLHPVPFAGGVLLPLTEQFPRTCLEALPTATRTAHDLNGDCIPDVVLTTKVRLMDLDGDGVVRRGTDGVHLRVCGGETIHPDGEMQCDADLRKAATDRVASGL